MATKYSLQLESIIKTLKDMQSDYNYSYEQVGVKDREKCDLEHELELGNLSYSDRCKLATKLNNVLKERRQHKDCVEELDCVNQYLKTNQKLLDELSKLLGQLRKAEKSHENRVYIPRIRNDLTIIKKKNIM